MGQNKLPKGLAQHHQKEKDVLVSELTLEEVRIRVSQSGDAWNDTRNQCPLKGFWQTLGPDVHDVLAYYGLLLARVG